MYAVAGVSGKTGAVVADALLAKGAAVRVIVRDAAKGASWKARGAEVAVADLGDRAALTAALRGVAGAYLLVPPVFGVDDPVAAGIRVAEALADAARDAKVPHVVLLSSVGAQHAAGTGPIATLHRAEALLAAAAPTTALRATYFAENWGSVAAVAKSDGVLPSFIPADVALPEVGTADIGRVAAELLVEGPRGQRVIQLIGPVDPKPGDVAAAFGRALGRPVQLVVPPLETAVPTLIGAGLPAPWAELYAEMYRGIASGLVALDDHPVRRGTVSLDDTLRTLI